MRLNLLKSIARSLLRTANRRLSQYRKLGLKNPDIEDILDEQKGHEYTQEEVENLENEGGIEEVQYMEREKMGG